MDLRRAGLVVALVALLSVGIVACNDSSDGEKATKPPPATDVETAPQTACTLVTAADAAVIFGEPAQPKTVEQPKSVASQCVYEDTSLNGQLLQFRIFPDQKYYSQQVAEHARALRTLGPKAYVDTSGPGGIVDLQFVRDGKVYALDYSNSLGDAPSRAGRLVALAKSVDQRR